MSVYLTLNDKVLIFETEASVLNVVRGGMDIPIQKMDTGFVFRPDPWGWA